MDRLSHQTEATIAALLRCHSVCLSTAMTRQLEEPTNGSRPQHIRLMMDAAVVCASTAQLLAHKSQFQTRACAFTADICETCAKDCAQLDGFDDCLEACELAAALCREKARPAHAEILEMASRLPPSA
jgi:hypothetical protein